MMQRTLIFALGILALAACDDDENGEITGLGEPNVVIYTQADRIGLPAINTVFIPAASKDDYNHGVPVNDRAAFGQFVVDFLVNVTGRTQSDAEALRDVLLPDMLPIDLTQPTCFLNGRTLEDDVVTAELALLFGANASLNDDNVDANDVAFSNTFPYLAEPHTD